jgi:hypothetical protein
MDNNDQTLKFLECSIQKFNYNLKIKASWNESQGMPRSQRYSFLNLHTQQIKTGEPGEHLQRLWSVSYKSDKMTLKKYLCRLILHQNI